MRSREYSSIQQEEEAGLNSVFRAHARHITSAHQSYARGREKDQRQTKGIHAAKVGTRNMLGM